MMCLPLGGTSGCKWEEAQQAYVLLYPEGMVELDTAAAILTRCNATPHWRRSLPTCSSFLGTILPPMCRNFWRKRMQTAGSAVNGTGKPLWLLAELTYRCPLQVSLLLESRRFCPLSG